MKSVAQARSNATEQSSNLFAGISGTELSAEQADAVEGEALMQIVAFVVVFVATIQEIH